MVLPFQRSTEDEWAAGTGATWRLPGANPAFCPWCGYWRARHLHRGRMGGGAQEPGGGSPGPILLSAPGAVTGVPAT